MFKTLAWNLYLRLKKLCEHVAAKVFTETSLMDLDDCVMDYLKCRILFKKHYSDDPKLNKQLSCKHCWLLHYVMQVRNLGPLALFETNIGESKNGMLRKLSTKANQTKNVMKTIAERELLRSSLKAHLQLDMDKQFKSLFPWNHVPKKMISFLKKNNINHITHYVYKTISWMGSTFRAADDMVICYHEHNMTAANFGIIEAILSEKTDTEPCLCFIVKPVSTKYVKHLGCLSLNPIAAESVIVKHSDLVSARPLEAYPFPNKPDSYLVNLYEATP